MGFWFHLIRAALMDLSTRLANLESERRQLRTTFEGLKEELIGHNIRFETFQVCFPFFFSKGI